ncbi:MAG: NADH-quinone oxidoreductase subunit NuoK [Dehalococcoidia bacterium]|nr:NADH-quinone oxidoreductase subunit NuoK [Dehalococcoidia bacterium]
MGLTHYLVLAVLLFGIGLYGALSRRHAIVILMCIELMLNAANIMLVAFSKYTAYHQFDGQALVMFCFVVAAAEVSVGLAIIITFYRRRKNIDIRDVNLLKW